MRRCSIPLVCLTSAVLLFVSPGIAEEDSKTEQFFSLRTKMAKRSNGLQLGLQASDGVAEEAIVQLQWRLDYDGPRKPCTVIGPSLTNSTSGQTVLKVYAESTSQVVHEIEFSSPVGGCKYFAQQDWFVTIQEDHAAKGSLLLNLAEVKATLLKHWPGNFQVEQAPPLSVQLIHQPTDRGANHNLDAWTGTVYSPVIKLSVPEW